MDNEQTNMMIDADEANIRNMEELMDDSTSDDEREQRDQDDAYDIELANRY